MVVLVARPLEKSRLIAMAKSHGNCEAPVNAWYAIASKAKWQNLNEARVAFRHADAVGDKTVFNIKGNDYRLIAHIRYDTGIIYIKALLTYAEYDKGAWKA